jgi:hypothetical protein
MTAPLVCALLRSRHGILGMRHSPAALSLPMNHAAFEFPLPRPSDTLSPSEGEGVVQWFKARNFVGKPLPEGKD